MSVQRIFVFLLAVMALLFCPNSYAAPNVIRFATVAPEGTSWLKEMQTLADEVKASTKGEVEFKIYSSAKMGDEPDVLRKMRSGQVHAGAFSGMGLGAVQPAIRVLEIPYLFRSSQEIDYVNDKIFDTLVKRFAEKNMVLIGTSEAGNVFMFSKTPIRTRADFTNVKMWLWEGDPLAKSFFEIAQVTPVPLPITDVITALQTGMVNAVYAPPMGMIGFQWWPKVSYMTTPNLNVAVGGILVTKEKWATVSPANQKLIIAAARKSGQRLTGISRSDNEKAVETLQKNNIKVVAMDDASKKEVYELGARLRKELTGKLYDQELLDQVQKYLEDFRAGKKT